MRLSPANIARFIASLTPAPPTVAQPRLSAQQHRNPQRLRRHDSVQRIHGRVSMHPQRIERRIAALAAHPADDTVVQRARHAHGSPVAQLGQELMPVSVQQGNVPLHAHTEALVAVSPHRKVRTEKHRKIDLRLLGDPPQQRRLVLDRVAHQIGQTHAPLRAWVRSFSPGAHALLPSPVARLRISSHALAASSSHL